MKNTWEFPVSIWDPLFERIGFPFVSLKEIFGGYVFGKCVRLSKKWRRKK